MQLINTAEYFTLFFLHVRPQEYFFFFNLEKLAFFPVLGDDFLRVLGRHLTATIKTLQFSVITLDNRRESTFDSLSHSDKEGSNPP